jgi:hypothetical protein
LPAALLAASLVSFSCRRLARHAARWIAGFFCLSTSCLPRRSLYRSFLSLADVLPVSLHAVSLVSDTRRRVARRTAPCIARFFLLPTSCPPRRSLYHSFLSLADVLLAAPLAVSLVSFSCRRLARSAARRIT